MLNAEWDRATVMSGAEKTRKALPDARFIKYLESTKHGFFPTRSLIVDRAVYRHFVEDRLPETDIEAKASVFDELIGKHGEWIRDPQRDVNESLPFDLFDSIGSPSLFSPPRRPYSRQ